MKQFDPELNAARQPFTTPEGYFDTFTGKMMARIAAETAGNTAAGNAAAGNAGKAAAAGNAAAATGHATVVKMTPRRRIMRYTAAAVMAGITFSTGAYLLSRQSGGIDSMLTAMQEENVDEQYINDVLDYEMVNNEEIAYYLTEAY